MDRSVGDHNSFSKFLLGWVEPKVVTNSSLIGKGLRPLSESPDAVILKKTSDLNAFDEYYMIEYRYAVSNDDLNSFKQKYNDYVHDYASGNIDGICIWHIDATTDNYGNCIYNNSVGDHKLIQRIEADGDNATNIQYGDFSASYTDFYTAGKTFSDTSNPNSIWYDGTDSGFSITDFSKNNNMMTANYSSTKVEKPELVSVEWEHNTNNITLNFNSGISVDNLTGASLIEKTAYNSHNNISINSYIVSGNMITLVLNKVIESNSKYTLVIPSNKIKNSNSQYNDEISYSFLTNKNDNSNIDDKFNVFELEFLDTEYNKIELIPENSSQIRLMYNFVNMPSQYFNFEIIVATYLEGRLNNISSYPKKFDTDTQDYGYVTISIPDNNCTVKAFVWDDKNEMHPMSDVYVIN